MADPTPLATTLPQRGLPVLEGNNFTLPWYRKLQAFQTTQNGGLTPAQVEALIAAALVPIEAEIANALAIAEEALAEAGGSNALTFLAMAELDGYGS